jgi:hypothetical protein
MSISLISRRESFPLGAAYIDQRSDESTRPSPPDTMDQAAENHGVADNDPVAEKDNAITSLTARMLQMVLPPHLTPDLSLY